MHKCHYDRNIDAHYSGTIYNNIGPPSLVQSVLKAQKAQIGHQREPTDMKLPRTNMLSLHNVQFVNFISDRISIHESITKLTSEIIKTCLAKDSKDNLSGIFQNSRL